MYVYGYKLQKFLAAIQWREIQMQVEVSHLAP